MSESGKVTSELSDNIGWVRFHHPKKNSLPRALLDSIADAIARFGEDPQARAIVLASQGDGPFCAGASFEELAAISEQEAGMHFFSGFAKVIMAMRDSHKFVIARVQGKVVGGGVGLVAAADLALATTEAAVRMSELDLGIGPFVVGPVLERRVGRTAFGAMAIDTEWRDASWALAHGLYTHVAPSIEDLDEKLRAVTSKLAAHDPEAMAELKRVLWRGTESGNSLLAERAALSGRLVLSRFAKDAIAKIKANRGS